ncbi:ribonuclease HII [Kurthia sibirica]|uniref:Ribonuclease HII n=1 Tax=Kurthia sibirica TaxID=202750 RepID=A0A2U3AQU3_9BACL|nr:ribonuclease HII [Kurthia sibirica]PWI26879.1 ribonuclease HII [Kurthia sibirica]GEK32582.1 ribonuclease HII [Kurthia sibirica]
MATIKSIKEALANEVEWQQWMEELKNDERDGVKKALSIWVRQQEKKQQILDEHLAKEAFDRSYRAFPEALIAGTDEAGRGPLAGPVVTAAVILPAYCPGLVGLNDSKQLSFEKREYYLKKIYEYAISTAIHFQDEAAIDRFNIYEATRLSMKSSIEQLEQKPDFVLADAMTLDIDIPQDSIIKGDAKSLAIAAASILAKTARDHYMDDMDRTYPGYGFAQHAGYGTKQHLEALRTLGITPIHRKTFEPIKSMLIEE